MENQSADEATRAEFMKRAQAVRDRRAKVVSRAESREKNTPENNLAYLAEMERRQRLRESEEGDLRERQMEVFRKRADDWRGTLPERWHDASLSKIEDVAASQALEDRIARHSSRAGRNRSSMVIAGRLGRGKTYLGYAYAYEVIARGILQPHQVVTTTETALSSITRAGFKADEKWKNLIGGQKRFWLINDVGRADFPEGSKRMEAWHDLIDHIYEIRGTLVITTNLPPTTTTAQGGTSLADWVGNSAMDRLKHMVGGSSGFVIMTGANKREEIGEALEKDYSRSKKRS